MLHIDPQYIPIVIINFLIVVFLLAKFLFKPLVKAIQDRQDSVEDITKKINEEKQKLTDLQNEYKDLEECFNLRKKDNEAELNKLSEQYRQERLDEINADLEKQEAEALKELRNERIYTAKQFQNDFVELSTNLAEKVINRALTEEEKSNSIDLFLESLEESNISNVDLHNNKN